MKVIAAKGLKCPKEGKPREYITDSEPVDVPEGSTYYRRLVNDGSLVLYRSDTTYKTNTAEVPKRLAVVKDNDKEGGKK